MKDVYIQIGSNVGNDYFFDLMKTLKQSSKIILIEPNPSLIEALKDCYKDLSEVHDVFILNVGICYDSNNLLYKYENDNKAVLSSILNRKSHPHAIDIIKFSPITFDDVCKIFNCTDIKLLCIDTEGYDYWILNNINIEKYKIETIECELWPYDIDSEENIKTGPTFFETVIFPKYSKIYNITKCIKEMETYVFILK